jgi:hypothetical protein
MLVPSTFVILFIVSMMYFLVMQTEL